ncbi:hypothetical protein LARV_00176 [Longilinea arvoryzae]|uniref:Uncharacterized protein n=1 Tax=Longilinea arvoryzae TaxID=360412 RepID=A0A0S7BBI3_9CHLR|nr:hypothetical protein [Longilinea arvoryzae]GAP12441.1 hypothetical protein LARV_00176 [Longilinea arvoryzae]
MTSKNQANLLDSAVAERVPASLDLTPRILSKIRSEKRTMMNPKLKLASTLLIVVLAVLAITTIVYAVYHIFINDPGLQAVQEAGLDTDLNVSAQPTVLPTATPLVEPQAPVPVALSQTRAGVTLTLDWIYLDEMRLGLGMSCADLPQGLELGAPRVSFGAATVMQPRGWTLRMNDAGGSLEYASYQVVHADEVAGALNLSIDVALQQPDGAVLDTFHFDLNDIPVYAPQDIRLQQTYAVRLNAVEVRLEGVRVSETTTRAILCYDAAVASVKAANVSLDGGPETALDAARGLELNGSSCAELTFPAGSAGDEKQLLLRVTELAAADGSVISGPWDLYTDLPQRSAYDSAAAPQPTAAPLGEQTLGDVTVSLDWFFVDAKRAAVGYTLRGLPDLPDATSVYGTIALSDAAGAMLGGAGIGSSTIERVDGQPGVLRGVYSIGFQQPLTGPEATFKLDITLDGSQTNSVLGYIPSSPEATPWPAGVYPPALPDRLVGTYHFEFSAPVHPMTEVDDVPAVTAGDIEMTIPYVEMTASTTEVMLCFDKPTAEDWWVMEAELRDAAGNTAKEGGGSMLYDADFQLPPRFREGWSVPEAIQSAAHGRCLRISFLLGHGGRSGPLTLTINSMEISQPEVIPNDQIRAAQEKLKAQGIEMNYYSVSTGSGGGGGPRFTSLPAGMSFEEAYRKFTEALGYVHAGPWVFRLQVAP